MRCQTFYRELLVVMFMIIQLALKSTEGKIIIVSSDQKSADILTCGSEDIPCKTIHYAISKCGNGDVLRVDGGKDKNFPYNYTINATVIYKSISIEKKYPNVTNYPNPIITGNYIRLKYVFYCYGSLSVSGINFYLPSAKHFIYCWFLLDQISSSNLSIRNCRFGETTVFVISKSYNACIKETEIHITQTKFEQSKLAFCQGYAIINSMVADFHIIMENQTYTINSSNISDTKVIWKERISIKNTILRRTIIHIVTKNFTLSNSTLKDSFLLNFLSFDYFIISKCTFDNSSLYFKHVRRGKIIDTTFKNSHKEKMLPELSLKFEVKNSSKYNRVSIIRCLFENNKHLKDIVPTIWINKDWRSTVEFLESKFISPDRETTILDSQSRINVKNCSFHCGMGHFISFTSMHTFPSWRLLLKCIPCTRGTYNLQGDSYFYQNLRWKTEKLDSRKKCKMCPENGVCENGTIRSKGAYWGTPNTVSGDVSFVLCPSHYCCPKFDQCLSYDTCANNRTGRLCSECLPGYSCSLNRNYKCVKNSNCNNGAVGFTVLCCISVVLILTLMYLKETFVSLKNMTQKKDTSNKTPIYEDDYRTSLLLEERLVHMPSYIANDPISYQLVSYSNHIPNEAYRKSSSLISGTVKIGFFFYQAASIIRIQSHEKLDVVFPDFFDGLSTFFNVRIDLSYSKTMVCILPDLSVIKVSVIRLGVVGISLLILVLIWIVAVVHKYLRCRKYPSATPTTFGIINDEVPSYCAMPILARIKCSYLQFLLIAYSAITITSLNAVNCVNIDSKLYLYKQASIQCYQPWQYLIIAFIGLWIIPFFLVLYLASNLLHKCKISPSQFLATLTFPPLILPLLLKARFQIQRPTLKHSDAILAKHLLLVINEPFKESSNNDGSRICWESMLILRRMLLVLLKTFIESPITKLYFIIVLFMVFTFQHVLVSPFSDAKLNSIEFFSLSILGSFAVVNIFWAVSREYNVMTNPIYKSLGKILLIYEVVILALPFLLIAVYLLIYIAKRIVEIYNKCVNIILKKQV